MASGKSLEKKPERNVFVHYNEDISPVRRQVPKQHLTKKERKNLRKFQAAVKQAVSHKMRELPASPPEAMDRVYGNIAQVGGGALKFTPEDRPRAVYPLQSFDNTALIAGNDL